MSSISFDNIYWLLIAIPLLVLIAVPFFIAVRKDNVNGHNIASSILHVLMAVIIAFTAAGTKVVTVITQTDVYVVADVSYSATKNLDVVDGYIKDLKGQLPQNSRMGVICFAKDYKLITRLGENFTTVKNADVDDSQTNIVSALNYAGTLFRDDVIKRIVLITDGKQTDSTDSNALKRCVDSLNAVNIYVDAIYLDDNLTDATKEVQVTEVNYTNTAYLNNKETASVVLQSNYQCSAILSLYKDGEKLSDKAVTLNNGTTTVDLNLDTTQSGTYDYEVSVQTDEDYNDHNNSVYFTQTVSGSVSILLVCDDENDLVAAVSQYGENANIKAYVIGSEISRDTYIKYGDMLLTSLPNSVEALCEYDEFILSDFDIASLNNHEIFLESLETAVSLFGKSLITMGNLELQTTDDETVKTLKDMLPVQFGNSEMDKKLYTLVLDVSRSIGLNDSSDSFIKLKQIATNLVDILPDGDSVCVVGFYGDNDVVVSPTTLTSANREEIKQQINALTLLQGTMISSGLERAFNTINSLSFSEKQVVLISDGINGVNEDASKDIYPLVKNMTANGIVTNVLDVGRITSNNLTTTQKDNAVNLLKSVASFGSGYYYYIEDAEDADDIIFGEIANDLNELVVERNSWVKINKRYDEVLEGITDVSYISGYVNSKAKASATTVLTTEYQNPDGGSATVPIYSYWNYGNGKVSTFTSKMSGDWVRKWTSLGLDKDFFNNVISTNTPDQKNDYPFTVEMRTDSGICYVEVTPATLRADSLATISVTNADGEKIVGGNLTFDSSLYSYTFSAVDVGKYIVNITYSYGGSDYTCQTIFNVSYGAEYDSFTVYDSTVLHKMVGTYGNVSENGAFKIENDENEISTMTVKLTVPLLIACVVLFAVDIIIRKLKWKDVVSFFRLNKINKGK